MRDRIVLATCRAWPELNPSDRAFVDALERRGSRAESAPWNGPFGPFAGAAAVVIRATWDYHQALANYRAWLERLDAARTFNAPELVRWNLEKCYLLELAALGASVPASAIVDADGALVAGTLARMALAEAVIKPTVGASGVGVERVGRGHEADALDRLRAQTSSPRVLVQEFMPEVAAGEMLSDATIATMTRVVGLLPSEPLYARIDGVERNGRFVLMEVEVNEPALGLHLAPGAADRFAEALAGRLRVA